MKKMNKKGFTLIELLAVIIILGILMIIAIPSVTSYIQNSRKSAYVDTAVGYMDAVMKEVNSSKNLRFFSTDTLYMVAVGHDKKYSCVTVESGGQSPFSDSWNYAYVGVTYDGKGYSYYFFGEDGAGQGIGFIDKKTLTDEGTDYLYSSYGTLGSTAKGVSSMSSAVASNFKGIYEVTATGSDNVTAKETDEGKGYSVNFLNDESANANLPDNFKTVLIDSLKKYEPNKVVNKVVFIDKKTENAYCFYKDKLGADN